MNLLDFLVLALAAGAVTDCWFNGSLFVNWRAFFQVKAGGPTPPLQVDGAGSEPQEDIAEEPLPWLMRLADRALPSFVAELLSCPFCFSFHAPLWLALLFFVPAAFASEPWDLLCKLLVYCLAATRIGNILNGLLPEWLRYER